MKTYRIENWPAILLAGICWLLGTGFAIEKVMTDGISSWTLLIAMPVLTLCVVVLLHMSMEMLKDLNPMGLVAVALAALALGVTLPASIGSVGAARDNAVAAAGKSEDDAKRIRGDYAQTQGLVSEAEGWAAKECSSGKGKRCDGVTFILNQRRASLEKLEGQIKALPPVHTAMSGESRVAWLVGKFGYSVSEADIQMGLPMLPAPVLEILSAFFGLFGARRVPVATKEAVKAAEVVAEPANDTDIPTDEELLTIKKQFFAETPKQVVARSMPALTQKGLLGRNIGLRLN